ncbi:MAG: gamma-glutamyl phosphate reductase [Bacteroides sp. SM23_62_1]|nr:MAG: gamma-glutamyl phosphate reductase [Bacteroides sp. SM23_62_1]
MEELLQKGRLAREASYYLSSLNTRTKNNILNKAAENLISERKIILEANEEDMKSAKDEGLKGAILDRLLMNEERIRAMSHGLMAISLLEDPVGEIVMMKRRPNGLLVGQQRVPIGVIGIIYESRPNVTADVFGLCLKTGNAAILRGGKEAFRTNKAITVVMQSTLYSMKIPQGTLQLVENTSRESAVAMMKLNQFIDLLIPRGGAGLIKAVVQNSTVPVIETGVGNCHIYIDEYADPDKAISITVNAKTQRPGVCNAAETVLIHEKAAEKILRPLADELKKKGVEIRGDQRVRNMIPEAVKLTDEDWSTEYLDLIIAAGIVNSPDDAINHINHYGSGHSECIVTENYTHAQEFLARVDAAAVYVNASTRFTDGYEFGFGAEIGISTQKLHARGPMGLRELTTTKYIIYGNGQIRV